jgi:hypothetical protein
MRRTLLSLVTAFSLVGVPALVGCEDTVHKREVEVEKRDGTEVKKTEKTVREPDGDVRKETETKTNRD